MPTKAIAISVVREIIVAVAARIAVIGSGDII